MWLGRIPQIPPKRRIPCTLTRRLSQLLESAELLQEKAIRSGTDPRKEKGVR